MTMEFGMATDTDGVRRIRYRLMGMKEHTFLDCPQTGIPTDPFELFEWMVNQLKEQGVVEKSMVFNLQKPPSA